MTASAKINLSTEASVSGSPDLGSAVHKFSETFSNLFDNGTGADQINQVFSDTRTLALSTSESLDLAGGLTNGLGAAVTFTKVKAIIVIAAAGNGDNIEVGGAASNALVNWVGDATDVVNVPPGGMFMITAPDATGFAVTASTGDLLKIANADSAASATYTVILLGVE
jgi:hypothetical protein